MGRSLRDIYWPRSQDDDAILIANRRALAAFCLPASIAGLILSVMNLPHFWVAPVSISVAFVASVFCALGPVFVPNDTREKLEHGSMLLMATIYVLMCLIYATSVGPYSIAGLFFIPFTMSVTLMLRWKIAVVFLLGVIGAYALRFGYTFLYGVPFEDLWLRFAVLVSMALLVFVISGSFREVLLRAAEHLAFARKEAEAANRAKSEFLANMSHEIRTPMNGVIGMADLLAQANLPEAQKRQAETICNSGQSLLEIINDILDFSKIEAGKLNLEAIRMSPRGVTEEVVELLLLSAREKGIFLKVEFEGDDRMIIADPTRYRQVLLNLIGNAVKFTQTGGVTVTLMQTSRGENCEITIAIMDTGVGIPADKIETIFTPFAQAEMSTTRRFGGTGLGLAITHELVTAMGGKISASSLVGKGTCFALDFVLPQANKAEDIETPVAEPTEVENYSDGSKIYSILVAEDNEINRLVLSSLIDREQYQIVFAHNGREAVDLFCEGDYAVIIMDISMPILDGMEATAEIRAIEQEKGLRHTPIIALTAHALTGDREKFLSAGMDDYLTKPLVKADLNRTLQECLRLQPDEDREIAAQ